MQGIKIIGIGKHGSKPLPPSLLKEIVAYLDSPNIVPIQKGAFYGALMAKEPTIQEQELLHLPVEEGFINCEKLYDTLFADAPAGMKGYGIKLLKKESLTADEARQLGNFLFSDLPGETLRGMAVSMLRIRYETEEEYRGLMEAAAETFSPAFKEGVKIQNFSIQLAEPFDGVEHSYMITPLVAQALQKDGYAVIVSMGRSSGPKMSLNTLDIYQALNGSFIQDQQQLKESPPEFGWALDQQVLSTALDKWVERRRQIFKRPFLATSEKVLNPCGAKVLITSVFHITYMEKMVQLAGMAGFAGVIVLKRGLEGTLAPSLSKASGILCAARQADGTFKSTTINAEDDAFSSYRAEADEQVEALLKEDNLALILEYAQKGATGNKDFDKRVGLALALYRQGLEWIKQNLP